MAICEQCGKEHEGTFGSGRFCCRNCSNKWVALHQSEEAKARKVGVGKKNLISCKENRNLILWNESATEEEIRARNARSAKSRTENAENRRKSILGESLITGIYPESYNPKNTSHFKYDLITFGYKEWVCESCKLREWLGEPIPLELHHLDGDRENNKLSNLVLLCPNCHSFTPNYRWRKFRNAKSRND